MRASILVSVVVVTVAMLGAAASAELAEGVQIEADGQAIDARIGHLVPAAVDWNGDGKKDLLVGQFIGGKIHLYLNKGTDAEPKLTDAGELEAGGKVISLAAG
jgi:hypothetical protein